MVEGLDASNVCCTRTHTHTIIKRGTRPFTRISCDVCLRPSPNKKHQAEQHERLHVPYSSSSRSKVLCTCPIALSKPVPAIAKRGHYQSIPDKTCPQTATPRYVIMRILSGHAKFKGVVHSYRMRWLFLSNCKRAAQTIVSFD